MRSFERTPIKDDPFGLKKIEMDIEKLRQFSSWADIKPEMPENEQQRLVLQYLKELGEHSEVMVMVARERGESAEKIFLMKTLYGAEMTRVWSMRPGARHEREFYPTFLQHVEWQHRVSDYLLDASQQKDLATQQGRDPLRRFWASVREIYGSSVIETDLKKQAEEMARTLRVGILRPVALGYALRERNGWNVSLPEEPEDDANFKVDLVAESTGPPPQTYLLQLKPPEVLGEDLEVEPVRWDERQFTPEMQQYARGFRQYMDKYRLDPEQTVGAVVRISNRRFDNLTGLPDQELQEAIVRDFALLDNQLLKN